MRIPLFGTDIPDELVALRDQRLFEGTPRSVACVVEVLDQEGADEHLAEILTRLLDDGVRLVCTEGGEGEAFALANMQPRAAEVLARASRSGPAKVIGVDDLGLQVAMQATIDLSRRLRQAHGEAIDELPGAVVAAATRLGHHDLAELMLLAERIGSGLLTLSAFAGQALALARRTGAALPLDLERWLISLSLKVDQALADAEYAELVQRAEACVRAGTFAEDAIEASRRWCEQTVATLRGGRLDLTGMLPDDSRTRLMGLLLPQQAGVHQAYYRLKATFDVARLVAIDPSAYPDLSGQAVQLGMWVELGERYPSDGVKVPDRTVERLALAVAGGGQAARLWQGYRRARLLHALVGLALSPERHAELIRDYKGCTLDSVLRLLDELGEPTQGQAARAAAEIDPHRMELLSFYTHAQQRASAMVWSTVEHMERLEEPKAVLTCLGWHLSAIQGALAAAEVSHVILVPQFQAPAPTSRTKG